MGSGAGSVDLTRTSAEILRLMNCYRQAIKACGDIWWFSPWPLLKLYGQFVLWGFCLGFAPLTLLVDIPLLLWQWRFTRHDVLFRLWDWLFVRRDVQWKELFAGRDAFLLGRWLYRVILWPFRSAWNGEVPALQIVSVHYLTRVLMYYRARAVANALHDGVDRQWIELMATSPARHGINKSAKELKEAFDRFKTTTTDRYTVGALAVLGPLLTGLSFATEKIPIAEIIDKIPIAKELVRIAKELVRSFVPTDIHRALFVVGLIVFYGAWFMLSAWMDRRRILMRLNVRERERDAFDAAGVPMVWDIPFDLLALLALWVWTITAMVWNYTHPSLDLGPSPAVGSGPPVEGATPPTLTEIIIFAGIGAVLATLPFFPRLELKKKIRLWLARRSKLITSENQGHNDERGVHGR